MDAAILKELKAREADATERPWLAHYGANSRAHIFTLAPGWPVVRNILQRDADLIVGMRNQLPELLAYIAKLEAERRELAALLYPHVDCAEGSNCGDCLEAQQYLEDHHLKGTDV